MFYETIFIIAFLVAIAVTFIVIGLFAQRRRITTGQEGMVGKKGIARTEIDATSGKVLIGGEFWLAVSKERIPMDSPVVVISVRDMILVVKETTREEII